MSWTWCLKIHFQERVWDSLCIFSCLQHQLWLFNDCHIVRNSGGCRANEDLPSTKFGQIIPLARGAPARLASNCLQVKYLSALVGWNEIALDASAPVFFFFFFPLTQQETVRAVDTNVSLIHLIHLTQAKVWMNEILRQSKLAVSMETCCL